VRATVASICGLVLLLGACTAKAPPAPAPGPERAGWSIDFTGEGDVPAGEVPAWADGQGFTRILGNPVYFFLEGGGLHLVAKPGPIHRKRVLLAITNRDKLKSGLESKVLLRLTPGDFALDPAEYPRLRVRMAPVTLPGKGADLRDPDLNDACLYLLLGFGEPIHEFSGIPLPDTVAYVWANREWESETASDPDYREFLRYVAIGHGDADPGRIREITRNVVADYHASFGRKPTAAVPRIRSVSLMVDGNTLDTKAESVLESIRFLPPGER
jgi:hypothetical protein